MTRIRMLCGPHVGAQAAALVVADGIGNRLPHVLGAEPAKAVLVPGGRSCSTAS